MNANPPPPDQVFMQILTGKLISRILTAVADVGVAEHLTDGPKSVAELADKTATNEDALYRMLRWINCKPAWDAWGHLDYSLKTGKPDFDEVFGKQVFEYFKDNEEIAGIFQRAMTSFSSVTADAVVDAYDFTGIETLVDVGGGHGALLAAIISKNPDLHGVVFDLSQVVQGTGANLGELTARIDIKAGDFFGSVPEGADAYIMKHIIHDWDDEHCIKIFGNCCSAMTDGGKVLVVDPVVTDAPESALEKLMDIEMLAMTTGGRERTEEEFEALLERAGLKMSHVVPTQSPVCIIEAVKA